jgi:hypothetical protein
MLLAFVSEPIVRGGLALLNHVHKTTGERSVATMNLSGRFVGSVPTVDVHETLGHDEPAHTLFKQLLGSSELSAWEYLPLIAEGAELLESVPRDNHSVVNFKHTNPFRHLQGT